MYNVDVQLSYNYRGESTMKLSYQMLNGTLYAKIPGKSVRKNGKVCKEGEQHLGRVIDKENNVFYSRKRGIFTFDPETGEYGEADEKYVSNDNMDRRKREPDSLKFGDAFFVNELIHQIGYDKVIEDIQYNNKDTLYAMITYYVVTSHANIHAQTWYEGSFAKVLYPRADLTSQRISDFLKSIGRHANLMTFFQTHMNWIKETICDDPAIIIDSTGLPNSIHMPLTAISTHNGKVEREARLVTMLQRDSGYPLMFRLIPGNIIDATTLIRSADFLRDGGIKTDYILSDAGYYTIDSLNELCDAHTDFLMRFPEKFKLYKDLVRDHGEEIQHSEYMVNYNKRFVYIKRFDVTVGNNHPAYVYLGYDVERMYDEGRKLYKRLQEGKIDKKEYERKSKTIGYFAMISSLAFDSEEILPAYYVRQEVEQYFDICKGSSNMGTQRVLIEDALRGHLLLCMIASTINVFIQKKMKVLTKENREDLFMGLNNHMCNIYKSVIRIVEPQKKANDFYKAFGIKLPLSYVRKTDKWKPKYKLEKVTEDE